MANNRLYLLDMKTGERVMLAKSFGHGWDWRVDTRALNEWTAGRDIEASYGNTEASPSDLRLTTENEK